MFAILNFLLCIRYQTFRICFYTQFVHSKTKFAVFSCGSSAGRESDSIIGLARPASFIKTFSEKTTDSSHKLTCSTVIQSSRLEEQPKLPYFRRALDVGLVSFKGSSEHNFLGVSFLQKSGLMYVDASILGRSAGKTREKLY